MSARVKSCSLRRVGWLFVIAEILTLAFAGCQLAFPIHEQPEEAASDASSNKDAASACDGSFETDPHNCGACGHDCLGGACMNGVCQSFTIATAQSAPGPVAADDNAVYWWSDTQPTGGPQSGQILMAQRQGGDGGSSILVSSNDTTNVNALVSDGTNLFFGCPFLCSGVYEISSGRTTSLATGTGEQVGGLSVGGGITYWTTVNSGSKSVSVRSGSGGAVATLDTESAVNTFNNLPLVIAGPDIYYSSGAISDGGQQVIETIPATGCSGGGFCGETFSVPDGGLSGIEQVTTDSQYVYWLATQSGGIVQRRLRRDLGDSGVINIVTNLKSAVALGVDEKYVYWLQQDTGSDFTLRYTPNDGTTGGGVLGMFQGYANTNGLALTSNAIFFSSRGTEQFATDDNGAIYGVAKPLPLP
jgi:hypothetical protein